MFVLLAAFGSCFLGTSRSPRIAGEIHLIWPWILSLGVCAAQLECLGGELYRHHRLSQDIVCTFLPWMHRNFVLDQRVYRCFSTFSPMPRLLSIWSHHSSYLDHRWPHAKYIALLILRNIGWVPRLFCQNLVWRVCFLVVGLLKPSFWVWGGCWVCLWRRRRVQLWWCWSRWSCQWCWCLRWCRAWSRGHRGTAEHWGWCWRNINLFSGNWGLCLSHGCLGSSCRGINCWGGRNPGTLKWLRCGQLRILSYRCHSHVSFGLLLLG